MNAKEFYESISGSGFNKGRKFGIHHNSPYIDRGSVKTVSHLSRKKKAVFKANQGDKLNYEALTQLVLIALCGIRMQSTIEAQCTMNLSELVVREPEEVQPFTYFSVLKSYRNEVLGTHPSLITVPTTPLLEI